MKRINSPLKGMIVIILLLIINHSNELKAQDDTSKDLVQYLFPAFSRGTVVTKPGKVMNLMLNYNRVSERIVFEQNGQYLDLVNPEAADTAKIEGRKFIPWETWFLEVIVNSKISLFVRHKAELETAGRPMGYGNTSQLTSSNYLSAVQAPSGYYNFKLPEGYTVRASKVYYLKVDGGMHSFLGEKQFLKIFPGQEDPIKQFIKKNRLKFDKTEDIARLIKFCNDMN